jgi:hypothetical protein
LSDGLSQTDWGWGFWCCVVRLATCASRLEMISMHGVSVGRLGGHF